MPAGTPIDQVVFRPLAQSVAAIKAESERIGGMPARDLIDSDRQKMMCVPPPWSSGVGSSAQSA